METNFKVSEVSLKYITKQKASERPKVTQSKTIYNLLLNCYDSDTIELRESFKILLLNRANKVLGVFNVSDGGINNVFVDVRLILQVAILSNASGIVLSHNHPSGHLQPSMDDDMLTNKVRGACKLLDISVLDHIIITNEGYFSYADEGKM